MTFRTPLPTVILHETANDGRIVVWIAEPLFRMGNLATMSARHRLAGGACNASAECLSGAKERRTCRLWAVAAILRRRGEFCGFLLERFENPKRDQCIKRVGLKGTLAIPWGE